MSCREPFEFIDLLGLHFGDRKIAAKLGGRSLEWDLEEEEAGYIECYYISAYDLGIEVQLRPDAPRSPYVSAIFFFLSEAALKDLDPKDTDQKIYSGALPFGIQTLATVSEVRQALGTPQRHRAEVQNDIVGFLGEALIYQFSKTQRVSYEFRENKLDRVVVSLFVALDQS